MARRPLNSAVIDLSGTFATIVETFKANHPAKWEELRRCPLQHGLEDMIEALKHGK